jgi:class 3 adenylate cyclase
MDGSFISPRATTAIADDPINAYVPRLVLERLARAASLGPSVERLYGAVLWADVEGFAPFAERMSRAGPAGAERLSETLDAHYGRILTAAGASDGDLQFFAGDGALIWWPAAAPDDLARATRAATRAALQIQGATRANQPADEPGRFRFAVGAGTLGAFVAGGARGCWVHLLAGEAIAQAASAARAGAPGAVVLSPGAGTLVRGVALRRPLPGGFVRVDEIDDADRTEIAEEGAAQAGAIAVPRPATQPALGVEAFVLPPIVARLRAGQAGFLAEFRAVSIVFVDLSALSWLFDLAALQSALEVLQQALHDHDGLLYQLVQDDRGTSAVAAFGLPGHTHDDDPVRAVRFARAAHDGLRPLIGAAACGVATGPLFCGDCGGPRRRQYSLFGSAINRAARLMAAASGEVLTDDVTSRQTERRLRFESGSRQALKGMGAPVPVWRGGQPRREVPGPVGMVGRDAERAMLAAHVDELRATGAGGVVIVEGAAGIGKTALLGDLTRLVVGGPEHPELPMAFGAADPIEARTPLFAFRGVMRRLLGITDGAAPADVRALVDAQLARIGAGADLLPLLNPVLAHGFPETELTAQMTGAVRAENRNQVICRLFDALTDGQRWVVALDDVHWLDAASWVILAMLRARCPGVLWVLAGRPADGGSDSQRAPVEEGAARLRLDGLSGAEVSALLRDLWSVDRVPDLLVGLLLERAEGNPLFCRELALALEGMGHVTVAGGACTVAADFRVQAARVLPATLSAAVSSRIDRLGAQPLLTLKVASVLGAWFDLAWLRRVLPVQGGPDALARDLEALEQAGCLRGVSSHAGDRFAFTHVMIQSAAYDLLPERQRRRLHEAAARALEAMNYADLSPVYGRLSYHFHEGGELRQATRYAALAAGQALDGYANVDAAHLFERALRSDEQLRGRLSVDLDRSQWWAGIAQAHYSLTHPADAREAYGHALRYAGFREPHGALHLAGGLLRFLASRALRALGAPPPRALEGQRRVRDEAALALMHYWGALDIWECRLVAAAAKAFAGYLLAERSAGSGRSAEAFASLGYLLSITPLRRLGEAELRRGVTVADASGELQAMASTRVMLGMHYTVVGRPAEALPLVEDAQSPAERLGAGLWKHRTRFMLAEPLLILGRFADAARVFAEAASLSRQAEPPVAGLATCFAALATLRLGRAAEALALIDGSEGIALCADSHLVLQRFAAIGPRIEVLLRLGRLEEAWDEALRAEALAQRGRDCDVYLAGLHGHAGVAEAYLELWRRARSGDGGAAEAAGGESALAIRAASACRRLRRFAVLYPTARPRADLLSARGALLARRPARALALAGRALRTARSMRLPFEEAGALALLAQLGAGPEREDGLRAALTSFDRLGARDQADEIERQLARSMGQQEGAP